MGLKKAQSIQILEQAAQFLSFHPQSKVDKSIENLLQLQLMKKSGVRKIILIHLLYFFVFVAFINFFHTDSILDNQQNCPACQFQRSNIALAFILFLFLITFSCLRLSAIAEIIPVYFISSFHKQSRAPPPNFS